MWKAVPDSAYEEETKQPAIIYGVYHLLRLLGTNLINFDDKWYSKCCYYIVVIFNFLNSNYYSKYIFD